MYFSKIFEDDTELKIIESTKLDNNILLEKIKIDENECNVVKLKTNQCAVLFEKGQVLDLIKEEGIYTIIDGKNQILPEDLEDYKVKNNQDKLCILFFNLDIIVNNKFYINKKNVRGEGIFDFKIDNPIKFFKKVITVWTYYSREELLEQIREKIAKIIISIIKEENGTYILNSNDIYSRLNVFQEYGIIITFCDTQNINLKKF